MAALEAGERAGGDVRGRQSAALRVVSGERSEHSWQGRRVDLHGEHHARPLEELRRLLAIRRAHELFERARKTFGAGDLEGALEVVTAARALHPEEVQFCFWTGGALANSGRDAQARSWLDESFRASDAWREHGRRLRSVGLHPGDPGPLEP